MKIISFILGILLCISCRNLQKDITTSLVTEWNNKDILFPQNSIFTILGKDTIAYPPKEKQYKILNYVDSFGCTACKLKLAEWNEFITDIDTLTNNSVSFYFYFYPKNISELFYLIKIEDFKHPVCIDIQDKLNNLNHFPKDINFQTFLLDKNNKVIAIGNPMHNIEIKKLYIDILTSNNSFIDQKELTDFDIKTSEIDFGYLNELSIKEKTINIKNTGKYPLVIQDINTSCGCIKIEYDKTPIQPDQETKFKIIYTANEAGFFRKNIDIFCNSPKSPIHLIIKGVAI